MKVRTRRRISDDKKTFRDDIIFVFDKSDNDKVIAKLTSDSEPLDTGLIGKGEFEIRVSDRNDEYYVILKGVLKPFDGILK